MRAFALLLTIAVSLCAAPVALAQSADTGAASSSTSATSGEATTGGQAYGEPNAAAAQVVPGDQATILPTGLAAAPADAPQPVKDAIQAANEIIGLPYIYGGGHNAHFSGRGYDCSGTVSFALHGGGLLDSPLDSSSFMRWGQHGKGSWITVYTNPAHAFMIIAGIRLDTSAAGDPSGLKGPRWRPVLRSMRGFHARHPLGL